MRNNGKRIVWYLSIVSFLNDISSEILSAILPFLLTYLGAGGVIIGLVGGLREAISRVFQVFFGYFSDKLGRRKIFVVSGYGVSALFKFILFMSTSWLSASISAVLERTGKAVRTAPRDAMISEAMPKAKGKGFGIHRTMDTLGAIIGSLIAFLLVYELEWDLYKIILFSAIVSLLSLLPFKLIKEIKIKTKTYSLFLSVRYLSKEFRVFLLISQPYFFASFSYMFLILYAGNFLGISQALGLYVFFNVIYALFAIPMGTLSDRIGRKKVIAIGYAVYSASILGFIFAKSLEGMLLLFGLYGLSYAVLEVNQRAFVTELSKLKGTALGVYNTVSGISMIFAGIIAGFLWDVAREALFIYGAVLSFISVILIVLWKHDG